MQQRRERAEIGRLRMALATSAAWTWRSDERGIVTDVERGHRSLEGLDCTALIGRRPWEILPALKAPPQLAAALDARAPFFDVRLDVDVDLAGSAVRRHLGLSGAPLFSATGTFSGYAGTAHDLTPPLEGMATARPEEVSQLRADLDQTPRFMIPTKTGRNSRRPWPTWWRFTTGWASG